MEKQLELLSDFNNAGDKMNTKIAFLYTNIK